MPVCDRRSVRSPAGQDADRRHDRGGRGAGDFRRREGTDLFRECPRIAETRMMRTQTIKVPLRDGKMSAYVAIPDRAPAGAIIAIMEIWGVNATMRHHAHEFAQAGFLCLVPDLFWRQE